MSAPAAPTFSPTADAGATYASFTNSVVVTISGSGNVFYTLDGSDPRVNGTLYASPLTLNTNTKVRAAAINTNTVGPVSELDYVKAG